MVRTCHTRGATNTPCSLLQLQLNTRLQVANERQKTEETIVHYAEQEEEDEIRNASETKVRGFFYVWYTLSRVPR